MWPNCTECNSVIKCEEKTSIEFVKYEKLNGKQQSGANYKIVTIFHEEFYILS